MLKLSKLKPAGKQRKRVGRGGARGGTAGRGHKGQKARSGGKPRVGFEGGQMPLFRRLPKRGFGNIPFKKNYQIVTIDQLVESFDEGAEITKESLLQKGIIQKKKARRGAEEFLVKVLGKGPASKKLTVVVDAFSKPAQEAIEKSGGQARLTKEK